MVLSMIEMPRGIRINVVRAGIVAETKDKYAPLFNGGFESATAATSRMKLKLRLS